MKIRQSIFLMFVLGSMIGSAQTNKDQYKLIKNVPIEGDGSWDYLNMDPGAGRLYISHGTCVQVLDLKSDKLAGKIDNTLGVHGIALAPEFKRGFISAGRMDTVVVFDLGTLKVTNKIPVGKNPDAIIWDPFSKRVFVFNGRSNDCSVIDAKTGQVVGTIALPGKPEYGVSDGKGKMFVNIEDKSTIVRFDTKTLKIEEEWPLDPGKGPSGLAYDPGSKNLFSACSESQQLVVMSSENGKIIATLPIGKGCDGCAFSPKAKDIFTSNGEGTLTIIHQTGMGKYEVVQTLNTRKSARTITCDPVTGKLYLSSAEVSMENGKRKIAPGSFVIIVAGK
jgi:YVTN family beta-propeller protein